MRVPHSGEGHNNLLDSQEYQSSYQDARSSPDDVGSSPAVAEDIQVSQINAEDVCEAVAEVNSPGKYPIGHSTTVRSEVRNISEDDLLSDHHYFQRL